MSSRFRDFVKLNPPIFLRSKVNEDPQDFLDDIYKVLRLIRVTPREKVELTSYQLRVVSEIFYTQCK